MQLEQEPQLSKPWMTQKELEAVTAAPESHRVIEETETYRVMEVIIPPGKKEPVHTHPLSSVMVVFEPTEIIYYDENGVPHKIQPSPGVKMEEMEPEGPHAVENLDQEKPYRAIRIEFK